MSYIKYVKENEEALVKKHEDFQYRYHCLIDRDVYFYGAYCGSTVCELLDESKRRPGQGPVFPVVHPLIVEQVKVGNTKACDIAVAIGVAPRSVIRWIEQGKLSAERRPGAGDRGKGVWHVVG